MSRLFLSVGESLEGTEDWDDLYDPAYRADQDEDYVPDDLNDPSYRAEDDEDYVPEPSRTQLRGGKEKEESRGRLARTQQKKKKKAKPETSKESLTRIRTKIEDPEVRQKLYDLDEKDRIMRMDKAVNDALELRANYTDKELEIKYKEQRSPEEKKHFAKITERIRLSAIADFIREEQKNVNCISRGIPPHMNASDYHNNTLETIFRPPYNSYCKASAAAKLENLKLLRKFRDIRMHRGEKGPEYEKRVPLYSLCKDDDPKCLKIDVNPCATIDQCYEKKSLDDKLACIKEASQNKTVAEHCRTRTEGKPSELSTRAEITDITVRNRLYNLGVRNKFEWTVCNEPNPPDARLAKRCACTFYVGSDKNLTIDNTFAIVINGNTVCISRTKIQTKLDDEKKEPIIVYYTEKNEKHSGKYVFSSADVARFHAEGKLSTKDMLKKIGGDLNFEIFLVWVAETILSKQTNTFMEGYTDTNKWWEWGKGVKKTLGKDWKHIWEASKSWAGEALYNFTARAAGVVLKGAANVLAWALKHRQVVFIAQMMYKAFYACLCTVATGKCEDARYYTHMFLDYYDDESKAATAARVTVEIVTCVCQATTLDWNVIECATLGALGLPYVVTKILETIVNKVMFPLLKKIIDMSNSIFGSNMSQLSSTSRMSMSKKLNPMKYKKLRQLYDAYRTGGWKILLYRLFFMPGVATRLTEFMYPYLRDYAPSLAKWIPTTKSANEKVDRERVKKWIQKLKDHGWAYKMIQFGIEQLWTLVKCTMRLGRCPCQPRWKKRTSSTARKRRLLKRLGGSAKTNDDSTNSTAHLKVDSNSTLSSEESTAENLQGKRDEQEPKSLESGSTSSTGESTAENPQVQRNEKVPIDSNSTLSAEESTTENLQGKRDEQVPKSLESGSTSSTEESTAENPQVQRNEKVPKPLDSNSTSSLVESLLDPTAENRQAQRDTLERQNDDLLMYERKKLTRDTVDLNGDGRVSNNEVRVAIMDNPPDEIRSVLNPREQVYLNDILYRFDLHDTNNDKIFSEDEIRQAMKKGNLWRDGTQAAFTPDERNIWYDLKRSATGERIKRYDTNGNGVIDPEEARDAVYRGENIPTTDIEQMNRRNQMIMMDARKEMQTLHGKYYGRNGGRDPPLLQHTKLAAVGNADLEREMKTLHQGSEEYRAGLKEPNQAERKHMKSLDNWKDYVRILDYELGKSVLRNNKLAISHYVKRLQGAKRRYKKSYDLLLAAKRYRKHAR